MSATFFDEIIVKEDDDLRDRPWGEAAELIVQGIERVVAVSPDVSLTHSIVLNEVEAIEQALNSAPDNALVVILPEKIDRAIGLIMSRNPVVDRPETAVTPASPPENSAVLDRNPFDRLYTAARATTNFE